MQHPEPSGEVIPSRALAASFVVRIWTAEHTGADPSSWRGQIVHVQSGTVGHFADAAKMVAFIREHAGGLT